MTDIRQLLMEANPVPSRVDVPDMVRAEVMAEVHRTPPKRRLSRRWQWPLPTILVALVAAGGVATAAALLISQDTKDKSAALASAPPVTGSAGPGSDYGAEVAAAARRIMATTPYPPAMSDPMNWRTFRFPSGGGFNRGALVWIIEHRATCLWRAYWITAYESGDRKSAHDAAVILRQASRWPALKSDRGDLPVVQRRAAAAAAAGDVPRMRALSKFDCDGIP